MIITLSGMPGSGKSTVAKRIAKKLRLRHYSTGDLRGKIALKHGMNIDELNKTGEKERWTDKEIDDYQKRLGKTKDNFIIDGRLGWHFIPRSVKIFLDVKLKEGAKRIFMAGKRPDEKKYRTINEALEEIKKRISSDKKRYKKYYNINPYLRKHYDLWIDTTNLAKEEVVDKVLEFVKKS